MVRLWHIKESNKLFLECYPIDVPRVITGVLLQNIFAVTPEYIQVNLPSSEDNIIYKTSASNDIKMDAALVYEDKLKEVCGDFFVAVPYSKDMKVGIEVVLGLVDLDDIDGFNYLLSFIKNSLQEESLSFYLTGDSELPFIEELSATELESQVIDMHTYNESQLYQFTV